MAIDYNDAKERITTAIHRGFIGQYGPRRVELEEREVERPGPTYWDKNEQWVDPNGVPRQGRFRRKPPQKVRQQVEVPKGVEAPHLEQYANAMAEAFLEVIRIIEEGR